jgi:2-succinyl-6-hydroxy-2,4-cyclohexadiene-1-carboxylate synthase
MIRSIPLGNGLQLHVERAGSGPPVVLLHGFTGSSASWATLGEALGRFSTITVDLPGHGRSSAPADPARYALPRFAEDLAATLDELHVDRAAVLGYSLGARAALHFALAHPARVSALILESGSPGIDDPAERAERVASDAALADAIERDGIPAFVDRWERLPLFASQAAIASNVRAGLRAQRLANDPAGLANSLRGAGAGAQPSVLDRLPALGMPTLCVAGALDARYVALGGTLASAIPGARLEIVPDAGHNVHLERPAAFVDLVVAFLEEVVRRYGRWA